MKFVMETMKRKEATWRIPVIKLEIDYELLTLYDAMQAEDHVQMIKSKERLEFLRQQMNQINNDN